MTVPMRMPERVQVDNSSLTSTFGRFVLQPLEEGFGTTIGNALRRVLLSSIPGSAFTGVKIEGVLHEFQTMKGVVEDVAEIILNLKEVRFRLVNKKATKITLKLKGPADLLAGDLMKGSDEIEILNPTHHIATLAIDGELDMELTVGRGRGYVPSEENKVPDAPVGHIAIDAIYTPIVNVRYIVEPTRVGQKTDYEKLTVEINTDGSVTPQEALLKASGILQDHIQLFLTFGSHVEEDVEAARRKAEVRRMREILLTPVEKLGLSVRSYNCLKAANIRTLSDLVRRNESEMLKFKNFGRKSLAELSQILVEKGLEFGMPVETYLTEETV
jgi:DNA-directed RNA polymerase subunit alpha